MSFFRRHIIQSKRTTALTAPVTITGTGNTTYSYVQISGVKYTGATSLTVSIGEVITLYVKQERSDRCSITIDGTTTETTGSGKSVTKTYTVNQKGCAIVINKNNTKYTVTLTTNS